MVQLSVSLLALVGVCTATVLSFKSCPIQFEGRIPKGSKPDYFDKETSLYNPGFVKGPGM